MFDVKWFFTQPEFFLLGLLPREGQIFKFKLRNKGVLT